MAIAPGASVVSAIENGVAQITRRMEIYQKDGVTPWYATSVDNPLTKRLVSGSISVDYSSDERRKGDITLLNDDFAFRLNPLGGFYYDKIIKLYRGVQYSANIANPQMVVIDTDLTVPSNALTQYLRVLERSGFDVTVLTSATTYDQIMGFDVISVISESSATAKHPLLKEAWQNGKTIFTIGTNTTSTHVPFIATSSAYSGAWGLSPTSNDNPLLGKLAASTGNVIFNGFGQRILTLTSDAVPIIRNFYDSTSIVLSLGTNKKGALWFDYHLSSLATFEPEQVTMLTAMADYISNPTGASTLNWEVQLGEFMIDSVDDQIFPNQVKITFRDYTKKLLKDKLTNSATFGVGTSLKDFVRAIAANGGITDFRESIGNETFPADMSFDRDTERWKMIKDACTAFDYECFFDNEGYLAVRKFKDPTTSPIFHRFGTGASGNLISFSRSINDSRIYNIINVFGDPVNNDRLPFFGQAINNDPGSPTSTVNLGKRPFTYSFSYFESDQECALLARSRLSVMGLESYDINFSSLYYPWMEVGEIVQIIDPHSNATDPTRFLMDSVTLPLGIEPMSGTGKRVTLVGSPG